MRVGEEEVMLKSTPPPSPFASFSWKVQLIIVGAEEDSLYIAPPTTEAPLFWNKQLVSKGAEEVLYIPAPIVEFEELWSSMMQLVIVGAEELL